MLYQEPVALGSGDQWALTPFLRDREPGFLLAVHLFFRHYWSLTLPAPVTIPCKVSPESGFLS